MLLVLAVLRVLALEVYRVFEGARGLATTRLVNLDAHVIGQFVGGFDGGQVSNSQLGHVKTMRT